MIETIILLATLSTLIALYIWPHIKHEQRLSMPDNWEPEHRGRVNQRAGGCYWVVGSGRVAG